MVFIVHSAFQGYNSIYSTDSGEDSERERGQRSVLGRLARRRFEAMLRGLSGKKGEIARCMAFSLEHAEAANEVGYPDSLKAHCS
jgi:U2-associated protein SR140